LTLISSSATDIGRRAEQQDEFGFSDPNNPKFVAHAGLLAVVIDGMGGVAHGGESARVGRAAFVRAYNATEHGECVPDALRRALDAANEAVIALGQQIGDPRSVGATLTAAVIRTVHAADRAPSVTLLQWISVGDSALYLFRAGRLKRLNVAHEVFDSVRGPLVTSFLGYEQQLELVDFSEQPLTLTPGDRVLLCTDGLFNSVKEQEIGLELGSSQAPEAARRLVDLALSRNHAHQDNVTALVVSCEADSQTAPRNRPGAVSRPRWQAAVWLGVLMALIGLGGFCRARVHGDNGDNGGTGDNVLSSVESVERIR
jgi:serine/threonine protein phosphatase PrpC